MTPFRPSRAPQSRLTRLGVVLDRRHSADRLRQVATMCERAGLDALWLRAADGTEQRPLDLWAALAVVAGASTRARLGVMIDARTPPETLASRLEPLDQGLRGRIEIGLSPGGLGGARQRFGSALPGEVARLRAVEEHAAVVRRLAMPLSIEADHPAFVAIAVSLADDVVIPPIAPAELLTALAEVRRACEAAGRAPESLGVAVEVPVSVGRTLAEAQARADAEPLFRTLGHPAEVGIFGRLEQCQDRVIELAHLGVTDLRCALPGSPDVHDVIAQLTAMVMGSTSALIPDAARSKAPDPPEGWGGRR